MKRNRFMSIMAGLIILTGTGISNIAMAQVSRGNLIVDNNFMNGEVTNPESDPKVEERNIKDEFRGINLTAQRFDQIKQARRQFHNGLRQAFKSNIGSILQLVLLPGKEAEDRLGNLLRNPMSDYSEALTNILTPEEIKIWQQNGERIQKRNQQGS